MAEASNEREKLLQLHEAMIFICYSGAESERREERNLGIERLTVELGEWLKQHSVAARYG